MIRPSSALLAVLGAVIAAPAAAGEAAWPEGIYSSVRMSRQTGDLGGMELRVFTEGGRPMVEVVLCEGWYNRSYTAPLERTGDGFVFSYTEIYEGAPNEALRVALRPQGKGFRAHLVTKDDPAVALWEQDPLLRPIKQAFGLAVAHSETQ